MNEWDGALKVDLVSKWYEPYTTLKVLIHYTGQNIEEVLEELNRKGIPAKYDRGNWYVDKGILEVWNGLNEYVTFIWDGTTSL